MPVSCCRDKALLFLWDKQQLELHGVFRPDTAAKPLSDADIPGRGAEGRAQVSSELFAAALLLFYALLKFCCTILVCSGLALLPSH
jgi:hypothetical protein